MTLYIGVDIHARQQTLVTWTRRMGPPGRWNCSMSVMTSGVLLQVPGGSDCRHRGLWLHQLVRGADGTVGAQITGG